MATTLGRAVRDAIETERAAALFYRRLSENTKDEAARKFLNQMAAEEEQHAHELEELSGRIVSGELPAAASLGVEAIESRADWAYVDGIGLRDAFSLALDNEHHAFLFYDALAQQTEGSVQEFFLEMADRERVHARRVREMRERILLL